MRSARQDRQVATGGSLLLRLGARSGAAPGAAGPRPAPPSFAFAAAALLPQPVLERLMSAAEPGLALSALREFHLSLAFACIWLLAGRRLDLELSHLGLPVLVWSLEATLGTAERLREAVPHPLDLAEYVLEGLFALALLVGLISLALGATRRHRLTLSALSGLGAAAVAVLTVLLDWSFALLLIPALCG